MQQHSGKSSRRRNQICVKVRGCACNMTIIFWTSLFSKFPSFCFFFFRPLFHPFSSPIRKSLQKKFSYLYLARAVNYGLTDIIWSFFCFRPDTLNRIFTITQQITVLLGYSARVCILQYLTFFFMLNNRFSYDIHTLSLPPYSSNSLRITFLPTPYEISFSKLHDLLNIFHT